MIDEESAARSLAAAKARVVLAQAGSSLTEYGNALAALRRAEETYRAAVTQ